MISQLFNCLFVHIPKTAGQSIEQLFIDAHGLDLASRDALLLRANDDPALGPRRLAHLTAREYVELGYVSEPDFRSLFRFAVVRHPVERLISAYRYRTFRCPTTIEQFFAGRLLPEHQGWARHLYPQWQFVLDRPGGESLVDRLLRFEELASTLPPLLEPMLRRPVTLPLLNRSTASAIAPEDLDPAFLDEVQDYYADDFALTGYARIEPRARGVPGT